MTDRNPQIGETFSKRIGGNLTESFRIMQDIRAQIEAIQETARVQAVLQQHMNGKISALSVQYMDIVKCPEILDYVTPISREPDIEGKIILWEGYQRPGGNPLEGSRGDRGQLHRVVQMANGHRVFCKYNSVQKTWVTTEGRDKEGKKIPNRFPPLGFGRPNSEDWSDIGANTVSRTVMNARGETVTRRFVSGPPAKTVRR